MDVLGAVIGQQFCFPDEIHLKPSLEAILWSLMIKGMLLFTVKEKLLSLHGHHVLADAQGNIIVNFKKKKMATFQAQTLMTELDIISGSNKDENSWDFKVVGSRLERSCGIYDSNSTDIAQMHKQHTFGGVVIGKDTYSLIVYPNVDYAFIVGLVVILEEINADKAD